MINRFRKAHNEDEEDSIKEIDDQTLKYQRNILLLILMQHLFIFVICSYGLRYTYQIYVEIYEDHKITILIAIIVILLLSDLFKHPLKQQPICTALYLFFTVSVSFLFVIYNDETQVLSLLQSNMISLLGLIMAAQFQTHKFHYVSTFTWILSAHTIYIILFMVLYPQSLNLALVCVLISFAYICILLYQFQTDMLYEIEEYTLMASVSSYAQLFKVIFSLVEAMSGEFAG